MNVTSAIPDSDPPGEPIAAIGRSPPHMMERADAIDLLGYRSSRTTALLLERATRGVVQAERLGVHNGTTVSGTNAHDLRWRVDRSGALSVNDNWAAVTGYAPGLWTEPDFVRRVTHPADLGVWLDLAHLDPASLPLDRVVHIEQPDGRVVAFLLRATHLTVEGGASGVALNVTHLADRTTNRGANEWCDALTGLPNRNALIAHLGNALLSNARVGLVVADIDRFRMVNEAMGHHTGDRLIAAVADRLAAQLAATSRIFRLGADEFAVVTGPFPPADEAAALTRALDAPFVMDSLDIQVSATIGIAASSADDSAVRSASGLLRAAEVALYEAKRHGSAVSTHRPGLRQATRHELALVAELRRAIAERELEIVYQPVVDLASARVTKLEALVRWRHRRLGLLLPQEFIESAEATRLIHPLTRWLLAEAARHMSDSLPPDITVAVNVSVRNLEDKDFGSFVELLSTVDGLDAHRLELEITERDLMADPASALDVLGQVRRVGIGVMMDDFGTGHASLAALKQLPVDGLKLDRSFVSALADDHQDRAIVSAIATLAATLGLTTTAEGVTDGSSLRYLAAVGVHCAQGFWLARPTPVADLPSAIENAESRAAVALDQLTVP